MSRGDGNYAEAKIVVYFFEGLIAPILEFGFSLAVAMFLQSIYSIEEILKYLTGDIHLLANSTNILLMVLAVMMLFRNNSRHIFRDRIYIGGHCLSARYN